MLQKTKICRKCGILKKLSDFFADKSKGDGVASQCKECRKKYQQSETFIESVRKYQASDKCRETRKNYKKSQKGREIKAEERQSKKHKEQVNKWHHLAKANLSDYYVSALIGNCKSPQLIELKRQQIQIHRAAKELKQAASRQHQQ